MKVSVSILVAGKHIVLCVSSGKRKFRSHANLMTGLWAEFSCVFPLPKRWPFGTHRRKKMKPFQQLSLCFGCEKSSWRIKLKSMLACDTLIHTTPQWAGDPSSFPVLPQGHNIERRRTTVWPLNFALKRVAWTVQNRTDDCERRKEKTTQLKSLIFASAVMLSQSSVGMNGLCLHLGIKEINCVEGFKEFVAHANSIW